MDGYAEYVAMAGPNLPLTPTYKVHGKATAVATTIAPYLTIYLEGDAWVEPTPAGDSAVGRGEVVIYRAGRKVQTGWQRQSVPGATTPPSGKRTYYSAPSKAAPCTKSVSRPPTASPCSTASLRRVAKAYVVCKRTAG
jgi:hypothetical protein